MIIQEKLCISNIQFRFKSTENLIYIKVLLETTCADWCNSIKADLRTFRLYISTSKGGGASGAPACDIPFETKV